MIYTKGNNTKVQNIHKKHIRGRQDSNLRSQRETDFQSVALTTRPRLQDINTVPKQSTGLLQIPAKKPLSPLKWQNGATNPNCSKQPGQLSRQSMRLLISGSWVRAPRWAQTFFNFWTTHGLGQYWDGQRNGGCVKMFCLSGCWLILFNKSSSGKCQGAVAQLVKAPVQ